MNRELKVHVILYCICYSQGIRSILGFSCTNLGSQRCGANPGIAQIILCKPCPRLALFARTCMYCFLHPWFCLRKLADCFPAKVAVCCSWFAFVQSIPYAGSWNQGAMPSHGTRIRMLATRNDTAPLSLRRPNKGAEKACAYARLLRGVKHANLAQVCLRYPIIARSVNQRSAQENPRMARNHTLCTTYIYRLHYSHKSV